MLAIACWAAATVLLLVDGKEVYRGSGFINMEELEIKINNEEENI